ncbi:MAG: HAD family hydrolase [Bacteroidales bacterium]|nr:HAD family hydrolase [Bacteroidales bacterium]
MRESFVRLGRPVPKEEEMVATIGRPLWKAFQTLGNMTEEEALRMAIVTSRDRHSLDLILQNNGIDKYFETEVTVDDHLTPKPAPDMVLALLARMEIRADETLVVGDTTFDIEMGNRAGCKTCAVTWGNHSHELLATVCPDLIIDELEEILRDIKGI